ARARAALEDAIAALLARAAFLHPAGFVRFDPALLEGAPREIGLRALAAILTTVSGHPYPPRLQGLERLLGGLPRVTEGGKTLGGCRLLASRGTVLVCREPAAMASAVPLVPGGLARWDGRFGLKVPLDAPQGLTFGALLTLPGIARPGDIPGAVVPTLPALRLDREVVFAPHLRYVKPGWDAAWVKERVRFQPTRPLTHAGFTVV
ncbi:MAG TPA: tRNA lysidine(34) synthetase TilS, partial [Stellaceae bacterium]|nr:tRNA lysidine(34) synthetase TilS [Stellaceae bacterium]